jgi:hypothetical protein
MWKNYDGQSKRSSRTVPKNSAANAELFVANSTVKDEQKCSPSIQKVEDFNFSQVLIENLK